MFCHHNSEEWKVKERERCWKSPVSCSLCSSFTNNKRNNVIKLIDITIQKESESEKVRDDEHHLSLASSPPCLPIIIEMLSLNLLISQFRRKVKERNAEDHSSIAPSSPRLPIPSWWRKLWQGEHHDHKNFYSVESTFWVRLIWAQSFLYYVWQN